MLNATIDRFAFESISPHDDQVAFHARSRSQKNAQGYTTAVAVGRAAAPRVFEHRSQRVWLAGLKYINHDSETNDEVRIRNFLDKCVIQPQGDALSREGGGLCGDARDAMLNSCRSNGCGPHCVGMSSSKGASRLICAFSEGN